MRLSLLALSTAILAGTASAQTFPRVPQRTAVYDGAGLLSEADEQSISQLAQSFMSDTGAPIVVATLPSLETYGAKQMGIERYSTALFNRWRIGRHDANGGILLVVAKADRKTRIELGKDWQQNYNAAAKQINQTTILPAFKRGDFSGGIRQGVTALAQMANSAGQVFPPMVAGSTELVDYTGEESSAGSDYTPLLLPGMIALAVVVTAISRRSNYGRGRSSVPRSFYSTNYRNTRDDATDFTAGMIAGQIIDAATYDPSPFSGGISDPGSSFDAGGGFDSGSSGGGGDTGSW